MLKKILIMAMFASIPAIAMGCGSDEDTCVDLCEEAKGCDGANQDTDCAKTCADATELNEKLDCTSEYGDVLSCSGDQDICAENNDACKSEAEAYVGCVLLYCLANPTSAECSAS